MCKEKGPGNAAPGMMKNFDGMQETLAARDPATVHAAKEAEELEQKALCFRVIQDASGRARVNSAEERAWDEIVNRLRSSFRERNYL